MREEKQNVKRKNQKFRFLEDIALADIAFEAYGKTLEELFKNSAQATFEVMVETGKLKHPSGKWGSKFKLELTSANRDALLYDFLSELIAIKDEHFVVLGRFDVRIVEPTNPAEQYFLQADVFGQPIDSQKHHLRTDVKAVTWHLLKIEQTTDGYKVRVVLDV